MTTITATYSPDDNKLRLSASSRLDADTYARVKAAGFRWAPKLDQFIAPAWSPAREDLALELAGEITDEDGTLSERAEARAERFEEYGDKRAADAQAAERAVSRIANNIPFGQPILVGHHSERHARRDAKRIESGMRRVVDSWETSAYWTNRAAAAIRHAKYKERPDVRARRIKTLEAEARKMQRQADDYNVPAKYWRKIEDPDSIKRKDGTPTTLRERALFVANRCRGHYCFPLDQYPRPEGCSNMYEGHMSLWSALDSIIITPEQARDLYLASDPALNEHFRRWAAHYANRLAYERAMLAADGGTVADKTGPEKGGACKCWASPRGGWSYIQKVNKVSVTLLDNWGNGGRNFTRTIPFDKLAGVMTRAEVEAARADGRLRDEETGCGFYLADKPAPEAPTPEPVQVEQAPMPAPVENRADALKAARERLEAGVQVVTASQLFPTPPELAARMVEAAGINLDMTILEPSAGTGRLLQALPPGAWSGTTAVEIVPTLAAGLERARHPCGNHQLARTIKRADFLQMNGNLGRFDRVIMNPPFSGGQDVKHIMHAWGMLKPGGRLVAICAHGPRQIAALATMAADTGGSFEPLPPGTFAAEGTGVNAALVVLNK